MSLSPEALAAHHAGLGSSDAADALGLGWKSPHRLWLEKTGQVEREDLSDNEAVECGVLLEPVVATLFERRTGKTLHHVNKTQVHPEHPWMIANLDRRVVGESALAEIKTAGFWAARSEEWGEEQTDLVPMKYNVQVQHQLAVTGYELGYLPVLVAGQKFRLYEIPRDEELIAMMIRLLGAFWQNVVDVNPPMPTNLAQAKERWPQSVGQEIEATPDILTALAEMQEAKAAIKHLERERDEAQGRIAIYMAENDVLTYAGDPLLTYKTSERAGFTVAPTTIRTMRVKGKK